MMLLVMEYLFGLVLSNLTTLIQFVTNIGSFLKKKKKTTFSLKFSCHMCVCVCVCFLGFQIKFDIWVCYQSFEPRFIATQFFVFQFFVVRFGWLCNGVNFHLYNQHTPCGSISIFFVFSFVRFSLSLSLYIYIYIFKPCK